MNFPFFLSPSKAQEKLQEKKNKQTNKEDPGIEAEVETEASLITTSGDYAVSLKSFYLQLPRTDRQDA